MKNNIKFIMTVAVLFAVFGCGFLTDKIEEKVNEEIEQQVKDSERKIDSIMNSTNMDSINKQIDSILKSTGQSLDSLQMTMDSLELKKK